MIIFMWLSIAILFLLLELMAPGLFFGLSISLGSALAASFAWLDYPLTTQIVAAAVSAIIAAAALTITMRHMQKKDSLHISNVYALIGKTGTIIEFWPERQSGSITIDGEVWTCKVTHHQASVAAGTQARVVQVRGSNVIVELLS